MPRAMVDSNVLIDVFTEDPNWFEWSSGVLEEFAEGHILVINPIVFAEVSIGFKRIEDLDKLLPTGIFVREPLPWEAAFLAGRCFVKYRRSGGLKRSPLPDFFIGAHAAVSGIPLITRDASRFRTYFPTLQVVSP